MSLGLDPIGVVHSPFRQAAGTPIQATMAQGAVGTVEVFPAFSEGLKDLDGFDRIWLLYWFDRAAAPKLIVMPYMDDQPHGVFATRAPFQVMGGVASQKGFAAPPPAPGS